MPNQKMGQRFLLLTTRQLSPQALLLIVRSRGQQTRTADSAEEASPLIAGWTPTHYRFFDVVYRQMNGVEPETLIRRECHGCYILLSGGRPEERELTQNVG
jgi:hypothetical protein